jgi:hypothetical protein
VELVEQDVEAGEVYALENSSLSYYRAANGSPAVRLGVGTAAISPDGKWVLLPSNHVSPKLPLQLEPNRTRKRKRPFHTRADRLRPLRHGLTTVGRLFTRIRLTKTSGTCVGRR